MMGIDLDVFLSLYAVSDYLRTCQTCSSWSAVRLFESLVISSLYPRRLCYSVEDEPKASFMDDSTLGFKINHFRHYLVSYNSHQRVS